MASQVENKQVQTRYIPVPQWKNHHDWPPLGGLRSLIFNRHENGFDKVIKKVGRRIVIDEAAFFSWVASHGAGRK
jgi:hypothetical protein